MLNHPRPNSYWGRRGAEPWPWTGKRHPFTKRLITSTVILPPLVFHWDLRTRRGEVTGSEEALRPLPPPPPWHLHGCLQTGQLGHLPPLALVSPA